VLLRDFTGTLEGEALGLEARHRYISPLPDKMPLTKVARPSPPRVRRMQHHPAGGLMPIELRRESRRRNGHMASQMDETFPEGSIIARKLSTDIFLS
jgi:hypothetical protein